VQLKDDGAIHNEIGVFHNARNAPLNYDRDRTIWKRRKRMAGKRTWYIPDGFLPPQSTGDQISHEAVCVLNLGKEDARIRLTLYFEDRAPMDRFEALCAAERTHHIRLDRLKDLDGQPVPVGVPYAIKVECSAPVIVQHSRLDTTQEALALFTTMAYSEE
jgi:hypothetical protein